MSKKTSNTCRVCKDSFSLKHNEETRAEMLKWHLCFTCNFWRKEFLDRSNAIVVNGKQYRIGRIPNSDTPKNCLGFSGALWYIRKFPTDDNPAVYIRTNNLWCQGNIPDTWYDGDTAKFISEEDYNDNAFEIKR